MSSLYKYLSLNSADYQYLHIKLYMYDYLDIYYSFSMSICFIKVSASVLLRQTYKTDI